MFKSIRFPRKKQSKTVNKPHEFMEWHSLRLGVLATATGVLTVVWQSMAYADADLSLRMMLGGFVMGLTLAVCVFYRPDWLDIYRVGQEIQDDHSELAAELKQRRKLDTKARFTCVYVIQDVDVTGYYKIGKSTAPIDRIGHFDTMLPFQTRVVHIIEAKDCHAVETMLHRHFASKRRRGEWFRLSEVDIAWLMQIEAV
jgi:hypothetical protein